MKTIFLLAPGPSLTPEVVERVRGQTTMAIKHAARLAPWADFLFFADWEFFRDNRPIVDTFEGRVLTISRKAHLRLRHKVELIEKGLPGRTISSGHTAVDVAAGLGFKRVVLVGYDCRIVAGQSHCHDQYRRPAHLYSDVHLPAWSGYQDRMRARSVEVINATLGSAIDVFPVAPLERVL
jgi:hypothetical protein